MDENNKQLDKKKGNKGYIFGDWLANIKGSFGKAPASASLAPDPDPREELILLILLKNQNHF
jgi:hypothetical protein